VPGAYTNNPYTPKVGFGVFSSSSHSQKLHQIQMDTVNPLLVSSASGLKMDVNGGEMRKNPTLICAPLMADSIDKMVTLMAKAKASTADLVEIRLDSLKNFNPFEDLNVLIKQSPLPTLFTYRPVWEGGQYDGDEKKRLDVLRLAMELGADYIDVELK
ncbi:hypothetical protein Goari_025386, partial [Gossypium aridum]|nr:hypothetical protein [Gossypium aridum]